MIHLCILSSDNALDLLGGDTLVTIPWLVNIPEREAKPGLRMPRIW